MRFAPRPQQRKGGRRPFLQARRRNNRNSMMIQFAKRMMTETDPLVMAKFAYNFGYKGMRSVELYKKRLKRGEHFPPFLFISVISSCNLRCHGCWVDVEAPVKEIALEDMNRIVTNAQNHCNSCFGMLGGEPFVYPELLDNLD